MAAMDKLNLAHLFRRHPGPFWGLQEVTERILREPPRVGPSDLQKKHVVCAFYSFLHKELCIIIAGAKTRRQEGSWPIPTAGVEAAVAAVKN